MNSLFLLPQTFSNLLVFSKHSEIEYCFYWNTYLSLEIVLKVIRTSIGSWWNWLQWWRMDISQLNSAKVFSSSSFTFRYHPVEWFKKHCLEVWRCSLQASEELFPNDSTLFLRIGWIRKGKTWVLDVVMSEYILNPLAELHGGKSGLRFEGSLDLVDQWCDDG